MRIISIIMVLILLVLLSLSVYLCINNLMLMESFSKFCKIKQEELSEKIKQEKKQVTEEIKRKHENSAISYEKIAQELKFKKEKAQDLEIRVKELEKAKNARYLKKEGKNK